MYEQPHGDLQMKANGIIITCLVVLHSIPSCQREREIERERERSRENIIHFFHKICKKIIIIIIKSRMMINMTRLMVIT